VAIGTVKVGIIHAGSGSAVGFSAYVTREARTDRVTGEYQSHQHRAAELIDKGILVPDDAPAWAKDGEQLWSKASEKQQTFDRKLKCVRWKENAQTAKTFVFVMPKELSEPELKELARDTVQAWFGGKGVACEWGLHIDETGPHLHAIVSTNELNADGFGKKARHLNPDFATKEGKRFVKKEDYQNDRWSAFQNRWFAERGVKDAHGETLTVDPYKIVAERTKGAAAYVEAREGTSEIAEQNKAKLAAQQQAIRETPSIILDHITERAATFGHRDVIKALRSHGIDGTEAEEIAAKALTSDEALRLYDRDTGKATMLYTTQTVRAQEERTLADVRDIKSAPAAFVNHNLINEVCDRLTMNGEQRQALRAATRSRFSITQGDPGTGKSHMMKGLREVEERTGLRVIGAAPTNTVAADMRKDGFKEADTLHAMLGKLDRGALKLDRRSVLIVDEAAMTDTAIFHRLVRHVASQGAALHIVGDDKQLGAVGRGGIYTELRKEHGASMLREISRQKDAGEWAIQASEDLSAGRVREAVDAYDEHKAITWAETQEEARAALVAEWNREDFVFASTNKAVDDLNGRLREKAVAGGSVGKTSVVFKTVRGDVAIATGDRVQMHGNDKKQGIYNGTCATVEGFTDELRVQVRFDDGRKAVLPSDFKAWGYGYAGTVYRGQGKTMRGAIALHDSPMGWSAESGLVAFTRHKERFRLFTSKDVAADKEAFVKQLSRSNFKSASVAYDAKPVRQQEAGNEQQRSATPRRFRNRFNAQAKPSVGEALSRTASLDSVRDLRSSDVAQRQGRPERAESVLPDHAANQLRREPVNTATPDGLRRTGHVEDTPQPTTPSPSLSANIARSAAPEAQAAQPPKVPSKDEVQAGIEAFNRAFELQRIAKQGIEQIEQQLAQQQAAEAAAQQAEQERIAAEARAQAAAQDRSHERDGPSLST